MRLLSLNIALFEANNEKLASFLTQQRADIVCLQEVTKKIDQNADPKLISKDSVDKATKQLGYSYFSPTWVIKDFRQKNFHQKEDFYVNLGGFVEFGNYIRSKFRIIKQQAVFLRGKFEKITDWENWPGEDSRAVQVVDLKIGSKMVRILNYHGIWTKEKLGNKETLSACKKINELAKEVDYPVIIAGDFNLFPDTESIEAVGKDFISLVDKYHVSTTRPKTNELSNLKRNVVDYIFVSSDIKVNSFEVIDTEVSDHLPLSLDFSL